MALPCGTTGSLSPTFVPARLVGLAVNFSNVARAADRKEEERTTTYSNPSHTTTYSNPSHTTTYSNPFYTTSYSKPCYITTYPYSDKKFISLYSI